jgi:hypothetical protein
MIYADLIVPRGKHNEFFTFWTLKIMFIGGDNQIAIDLIGRHVNRELQQVILDGFFCYFNCSFRVV